MPGAYGLKGAVQDWRYYLGTALTAEEVRKVAMETVVNGENLRTCEMSQEGGDQIWLDINGHDCAWYQEMRKVRALACAALPSFHTMLSLAAHSRSCSARWR